MQSLYFMHSSEVTVGGSGGHENLHTYGCDNTSNNAIKHYFII